MFASSSSRPTRFAGSPSFAPEPLLHCIAAAQYRGVRRHRKQVHVDVQQPSLKACPRREVMNAPGTTLRNAHTPSLSSAWQTLPRSRPRPWMRAPAATRTHSRERRRHHGERVARVGSEARRSRKKRYEPMEFKMDPAQPCEIRSGRGAGPLLSSWTKCKAMPPTEPL